MTPTIEVIRPKLSPNQGRPIRGNWFASTTSPNGNIIGAYGRSKVGAITKVEAMLREDGHYGTNNYKGI